MFNKNVFVILLAFCLSTGCQAQNDSPANLETANNEINLVKSDQPKIDSIESPTNSEASPSNHNEPESVAENSANSKDSIAADTALVDEKTNNLPTTGVTPETTTIFITAKSKKSRKTKTTTTVTTTRRRRRTKTTTTTKPEIMNEFQAKENGFLELSCGYESDDNDENIKWEKIGSVSRVDENKRLCIF